MNRANYGALAAKIRTIYGTRLRLEDFRRMTAMHSVAEVLDYLRQQGSWAPAAGTITASRPGRAATEHALREQTLEEFVRISNFVPREDRLLLDFPVRQAELDWILTNLRRLSMPHIRTQFPLPSRFLTHSKMDYRALETCADYDGLMAAARRSIYYPALLHLRPEDPRELPNYAIAESLLNSVYFSFTEKLIRGSYTGTVREQLLHALGIQVDLLNISHILRLKQYFPQETNYLPALYPFNYRLRPDQINALCAAPTVDEVFARLADTAYAGEFTGQRATDVEEYCRRALVRNYRRLLLNGEPSVCTAVAFLHLRALELQALIRVIESVNYGVPCNEEFLSLVGQ